MSAIKLRFYQIPGGEMINPQPNDLFAVERASDRVAQFIKYSTLLALFGGGGGGGAVASVNGATGVVVLNTDAIQESGSPTNKWYTDARVRACALTGLNTALTGAVAAGDSILAALGKLENRMAVNDAKDVTGNVKINADNQIYGYGFQFTNLAVVSGPERFWHFDSTDGGDDGQAAGFGGGTSNGGYDGAANPSLVSRIGIPETLTSKTLTSPVIVSGAFSGTISGAPTFSGDVAFTGTPTFSNALAGLTLNSPTVNGGVFAAATVSGIWLGQISADGAAADTKLSFIANTLGEYNFGFRDGTGEWVWDDNLIMRRGDLPDQIDSRIVSTWKAQAGGLCPLDGSSKVPVAYLPDSIVGQLEYQGGWNANTDSPTIPAAASGNKGWYYVVSVAGSTSIGGIAEWKVGDWIVSNGAAWEKIDNTDAVASVNGQLGVVVLNSSHISEVTNLYFTEARVRTSLLTGLSTGTGGAVAAGDSVLSAIGKLENRTALNDAKVTYADASVRACVLTGLSTASTAAVTASDSILVALGRHEARMVLNDAKTGYTDALVRACVLTGLSTSSGTAVTAADTILQAIGKHEARLSGSDILNAQTGTSYSLVAGDNGRVITLNNASAITLTVPSGLPIGFSCTLIQLGAGQVTVAASSTTINSYGSLLKIQGQYAWANLVSYTTDVFTLAGLLTA